MVASKYTVSSEEGCHVHACTGHKISSIELLRDHELVFDRTLLRSERCDVLSGRDFESNIQALIDVIRDTKTQCHYYESAACILRIVV